MSDHTPRHSPKNLALRTVTAVLSTLALSVVVAVSALSLPRDVVAALQGPVPPLTTVEVSPIDADRVQVCSGPVIAFSGQDASPVGYGSASEDVAGSNATTTPLSATDLQDALSLEDGIVQNPATVVSQPAEFGPLAATSYQQIDNLNVRGLSMAECQEPRTETWLVGGDTTTGRQGVLALSNPGLVAATVDIEVWGQSGPISAPLGRGILVAPGSQRVLSIAGIAPNEASPVLRVTSAGTGIVAALHTSIVRGLEADGFAIVTGQQPPSTLRVIPGLYAPVEELIGPIRGKEGYADIGGSLRVLSPAAATTVRVRIVGPTIGTVSVQLQLQAGQVGSLALDEIGSGDYSVILESAEPIVAGVRNSVGTEERTDTSWVGSATAFGVETAFAVPSVGETRIMIANPGEVAVGVSLNGQIFQVEPGAMVSRPIGAGSYTVASDGPVYGVVAVRGETILGHLQVLPAPPAQEPVLITVR